MTINFFHLEYPLSTENADLKHIDTQTELSVENVECQTDVTIDGFVLSSEMVLKNLSTSFCVVSVVFFKPSGELLSVVGVLFSCVINLCFLKADVNITNSFVRNLHSKIVILICKILLYIVHMNVDQKNCCITLDAPLTALPPSPPPPPHL